MPDRKRHPLTGRTPAPKHDGLTLFTRVQRVVTDFLRPKRRDVEPGKRTPPCVSRMRECKKPRPGKRKR